ncbi:MAG: hypothetical protein OEX12_05965, partial [Gammaproteobacteria bacterium]|nr:hypothetical protein [Gammaproteobacteria bacterium]
MKQILFITTALFSLAGCGGGGGGDGGGISTNVTLTGIVSDGYISGATVCLDKNDNKKCDADEPSGTTIAGGEYVLPEMTAADAAAYPIIAEIVVGAIDEDNATTPIAKPYVMATPAGKHQVVSPLTTMVNAELEKNPALGSDGAEAAVKQKLGYGSTDTVSLYTDYVAEKANTSNADAAEYTRLHNVARIVAQAVANNIAVIETASTGSTTGSSLDAVLEIVMTQVVQDLSVITTVVDSGVPIDQNLINNTAAAVVVTTTTIAEDIAAIENAAPIAVATTTDMELMYQPRSNGYHLFDFRNGGFVVTEYLWDEPTTTYTSTTPPATFPLVIHATQGWVTPTVRGSTLTDGLLSVQMLDGANNVLASQDFSVSTRDLSGKGIIAEGFGGTNVTTTDTFSAGSAFYSLGTNQQTDMYSMYSADIPVYNSSTLDDLLVTAITGSSNTNLGTHYHPGGNYGYELLGNVGATQGDVQFYADDGTYTNTYNQLYADLGSWDKVVVGGVNVLRIKLPLSLLSSNDTSLFLDRAYAERNGNIYAVDYIPAGATGRGSEGFF